MIKGGPVLASGFWSGEPYLDVGAVMFVAGVLFYVAMGALSLWGRLRRKQHTFPCAERHEPPGSRVDEGF